MTTPIPKLDGHVPTDQAAPELLARRLLEDRIAAVEEDMAADAQDAEYTGEQLDSCDYDVVMPYETAQTILAALPRANLAAPSAPDDWREIEQGHQPRLTDGYTAVRASKPGFWFVKGDGPAIAHDAPSAPAEVEGMVDRAGTEFADYFRNNYPGPDTIIHDPDWHAPRLFAAATRKVATALTALQAENERMREERDNADRLAGAAERELADKSDSLRTMSAWRDRQKEARGYHRNVSFDTVWAETCAKADRAEPAEAELKAALARLTSERDQARAEAAAAYERAALEAEYVENSYMAARIRALATEPGTNALAEILDAETRACVDLTDRALLNYGGRQESSTGKEARDWQSMKMAALDIRDAILARLDQRKGAGE